MWQDSHSARVPLIQGLSRWLHWAHMYSFVDQMGTIFEPDKISLTVVQDSKLYRIIPDIRLIWKWNMPSPCTQLAVVSIHFGSCGSIEQMLTICQSPSVNTELLQCGLITSLPELSSVWISPSKDFAWSCRKSLVLGVKCPKGPLGKQGVWC